MRRNATRRLSRTFALTIPDSARGFLFRRFPCFPLGSKELLCRKAFFFPKRHTPWEILQARGKCLDSRSRAIGEHLGQLRSFPLLILAAFFTR